MRLKPCLFAILFLLSLPSPWLLAKSKSVSKVKKTTASNKLVSLLQVKPYEKVLGTVSQVKGVFQKSARTVTLRCSLLNRTKQEIRAVRGTLRFTTYFGEPIYDLSLEAVRPFPPGQQVPMEWKLKRERFTSDETFKIFTDTPLDKMRVVWYPSVLVLADGTTLKP